MKRRLVAVAAVIVLLTILGVAHFMLPISPVRANEPSQIVYAESQSCYAVGVTSCSAYFPTVPRNKRLVIEKIATFVETNTRLRDVYFYSDSIQKLPAQACGLNVARNKVYVVDQPLEAQVEGASNRTSRLTSIAVRLNLARQP